MNFKKWFSPYNETVEVPEYNKAVKNMLNSIDMIEEARVSGLEREIQFTLEVHGIKTLGVENGICTLNDKYELNLPKYIRKIGKTFYVKAAYPQTTCLGNYALKVLCKRNETGNEIPNFIELIINLEHDKHFNVELKKLLKGMLLENVPKPWYTKDSNIIIMLNILIVAQVLYHWH